MKIPVNLGKDSYDIVLSRGILDRAAEVLSLDRKVMIVTDDGVPGQYIQKIAGSCQEPHIFKIPSGETSKSLSNFEALCRAMLMAGFTRGDCVAAVGGGVAGDLAGFAAACYMRGIEFYNIPTTLLSQVDSSIGGKTAIDFCGIKNIIGAFYQPKAVLIDPDTLETLSKRQFACGAAEIIKMAVTMDRDLFEKIEKQEISEDTDHIIERALKLKAAVVERDEKESGLRRVLNFGHTLGHGIEAVTDLCHGECVALGMLPMASPGLRRRLEEVLAREGLPISCDASGEAVVEAALHDKKAGKDSIMTVQSEEAGTYRFVRWGREELLKAYDEVFR